MRTRAGRLKRIEQFDVSKPGDPPVMTPATEPRKKVTHIDTLWKKGQSGNPSGNPADIKKIQHLFRTQAPALAKELTRLALRAKSESVRSKCLEVIFDRAYGKPLQTVQAQVSIIDQLPLEQQTKLAQALEALAAGKLIEGVATEVKDDAK